MKFFVIVFVILISTYIVNASVLDPVIENVVHRQISQPPSAVPGIWKKKTVWKPRWVKEWKSAKVMKPIWRKIWSPIQIREWVPIPKPPPGWNPAASTPLAPVKNNAPLWDPIPYPESQQPPPPSHQCGGECGDSAAFSQQQISGIIGSYDPDHSQAEFSETVTHLTRVPPNNWPRQTSNFGPELSQFLVPPRYQQNRTPVPEVSHNNGVRWTPLPPQNPNPPKGHFITKAPDQPYKFQTPERGVRANTTTTPAEREVSPPKQNFKPLPQNDFIQAAELVSEYHYSDFDLTRLPQVPATQPPRVEVATQHTTPKVPQKPQEAKRPVRTENKPPSPAINFTKPTTQELMGIFPIYKLPSSFPSNHRFAQLKSNLEQSIPPPANKLSTYVFETPDVYLRPQPPNQATTTIEPSNKTIEDTTPFLVFSTSSFTTTTEAQTEGPVYVVTPAHTDKS